MINHYIAIVSRFPKHEFGLKVKETKKEAYKAEKSYLGISLADIKTSLILTLYFDLHSGKSLLFLTDRRIKNETNQSIWYLFTNFCVQCAVEHAEHMWL